MLELMFRHDLLRSDRLGLRETSLPLFEALAALLAEARPGSPVPPSVAAGGAVGRRARPRAAVDLGQEYVPRYAPIRAA
ncbi:hypothetical protein [Dactylosporangium sp. CA-139066]|uniref:hypothetical protein n=1 Tax=Dactylosporangium sp. CA-139066 TaxID=3239930 RepID=UPI003D8BF828